MLWPGIATLLVAALTLYGPVELTRYICTYRAELEAGGILWDTTLELIAMWTAWALAQLIMLKTVRRLSK